jgi:hypothetical protein
VIMGDLSPGVGNKKTQSVIGMHGKETVNRNDNRLIDSSLDNNLKITNTFFQHKERHRYTWAARHYQSVLDYIRVNTKWQNVSSKPEV